MTFLASKRIFDIFLSLIAIMVFFLPSLIISITIMFFSKHPVIFVQNRVGKNKKLFKLYKFQTMIDNNITSLGRILRKTGLDEVPQFLNVLKNDMSITGPRALTENDIFRLKWNSEYYNNRWSVKPGITGLAQIYGGQNKHSSWFFDKMYLKRNHISADICLIIISFLMNIFGKKKIRNIIWPQRNLK